MSDAGQERSGRGPASPSAAALLVVASFLLLALVGLLGASAAKPGLGPRGWAPGELPWSLNSGWTTVALAAAYGLGAIGVGLGLRRPRELSAAEVVAVAVLGLLVAPFGSADHTNYAAYGRIALQGGDPWVESPIAWAGGHDPVTSGVQPPWQTTPSIYGPVATLAQLIAAAVGGDNLRQVVWAWQWIVVAGWLAGRWILRRLFVSQRARVDVLWTANPILVGTAVFGAHVDVLATAAVLAALLLARRTGAVSALGAGVLAGLGIGVKVTAGVVLLAIALGWVIERRGEPRGAAGVPTRLGLLVTRLGLLLIGAAMAVLPAHLWAGPHVFDQLVRARRAISLGTPWRKVYEWTRGIALEDTVRSAVFGASAITCVILALAVWRLVRPPATSTGRAASRATTLDASWSPGRAPDVPGEMPGRVSEVGREPRSREPGQAAIAITFALSLAYAVGAPYTLPWYDQLVWALLPGVGFVAVDRLQVVRGLVATLAYIPGRVVGMSAGVEALTLGWRRNMAPAASLLVWLVLLWWWRRPPERRRVRGAPSATPRADP